MAAICQPQANWLEGTDSMLRMVHRRDTGTQMSPSLLLGELSSSLKSDCWGSGLSHDRRSQLSEWSLRPSRTMLHLFPCDPPIWVCETISLRNRRTQLIN